MNTKDLPTEPLISGTPAWRALSDHAKALDQVTLRELFERDPQRGQRFAASAGPLYFDFAKDHLTEETLTLLCGLAHTADLTGAIDNLFGGETVNNTENRPALHVALRSNCTPGNHFEQAASATLARFCAFATRIRDGKIKGTNGQAFRHIVNLGIGGSDLGPRLVTGAFPSSGQPNLNCHFVANIDSDELTDTLARCEPETTLFIISSKSFSTLETLSNAQGAIAWLRAAGMTERNIAQHLVAVTGNSPAALKFGITEDRIFPVPDWVGGRFSLWSAIGLPVVISLGEEVFRQLLHGAREMDQHFRNTDWRNNLPVLHGLQAIWHINFRGYKSRAVLPYVHHLRDLPAYLQQLTMESLGKSTTKTGRKVDYSTGQVIWGSEGTNGQHSFHQLLLQGTEPVSVDFIATREAHCDTENHRHLLGNCLAQSQALMAGKSAAQSHRELLDQGLEAELAKSLAPHKAVPGNRPSNTLLLDDLKPRSLGALLAFYEHSVFVQSVIWNINAFDQWGVELGKTLHHRLFQQLDSNKPRTSHLEELDSSTNTLIETLTQAPNPPDHS